MSIKLINKYKKKIRKFLNKNKKLILLVIANLIMATLLGIKGYDTYKIYTAPAVVSVNQEKLITVEGPIRSLYEQYTKIKQLIKNGDKEIFIKINSPGGYLTPTNKFLKAMNMGKYFGVKFTCIVEEKAASAATIILSNCDNRYAMFDSRILWHSMLTSGNGMVLNQYSTSKLLSYILAKNEELWADTRIHFFPWYFVDNFEKERYIPALEVQSKGFWYVQVIRELKIVPKTTVKKSKNVIIKAPVYNPFINPKKETK